MCQAREPQESLWQSEFLITPRKAKEDAGGRTPFIAWGLGTDISTSARSTAIDPGGSRRVEERQRLTLSGLPVQRVTTGLPASTGILADWRTVLVPVFNQLVVIRGPHHQAGYRAAHVSPAGGG